jgi:hypothetical protein
VEFRHAGAEPDTITEFENGKPIRQEVSTNSNGIRDLTRLFNGDQLLREEADTNGDRRPDVWVSYEGGVKATQEEDLDFDGQPDVRYRFQQGRVTAKEVLTDRGSEASPQRAAVKPVGSVN